MNIIELNLLSRMAPSQWKCKQVRRKTSRYIAHEMTNKFRNNSMYKMQIFVPNSAIPTACENTVETV